MICGFFLILIGLILPHKKVDVDDASPNPSRVILVDQQAVDYNTHLKTSHLIGISLVVFGGILFTLSLLIPTFCHMWCEGDDANDEADPLKVTQSRFSRLSECALLFLAPNGSVSE